jgi:hypothetical protein
MNDSRSQTRKGVLSLVMLLVAIGLLVFFLASGGNGGRSTHAPAGDYAFNSRDEIRRAERRLDETVLREQLEAPQAGKTSGSLAIKATHCAVTPPPPPGYRLVCRVLTSSREAGPKRTVTRSYSWGAVVRVNPRNGALSLRVRRPRPASTTVTPHV